MRLAGKMPLYVDLASAPMDKPKLDAAPCAGKNAVILAVLWSKNSRGGRRFSNIFFTLHDQ
jgi:hypothetical protein